MSDDVARDEVLVKTAAPTDDRLFSVTTIIKAASSSEGLIYWAATETAKAAVGSRKTLDAIIEEQGADAATDWLENARFRRQRGARTAAELGTAVHQWCEDYALTGERPPCDDELRPFCEQFDGWLQKAQPVAYEAAEMTVFSPRYCYAGTADAIIVVGGVRFIVDYKTSRKSTDNRGKPTRPYSDVALQLAAYRHAELLAPWREVRRWKEYGRRYYLLSEAEKELAVEVPPVDGGLAIHITPDHCNAHPVRCDEEVFNAFLFALEVARYQLNLAKDVILPPLVFPGAAA